MRGGQNELEKKYPGSSDRRLEEGSGAEVSGSSDRRPEGSGAEVSGSSDRRPEGSGAEVSRFR